MKNVPRLAVLVVVLAMSVVAALPASAAPDRASDLPQYQVIGQHTVKQGEWLYCIGRAYQVSPWAIAEQNHIPWPYWVYPNQVLQIPAVPWYNIPAGQTCAPQFTGASLAYAHAPAATDCSTADPWAGYADARARSLPVLSLRAMGTDPVGYRLVLWHHSSGCHVCESQYHEPEPDLCGFNVVHSVELRSSPYSSAVNQRRMSSMRRWSFRAPVYLEALIGQ